MKRRSGWFGEVPKMKTKLSVYVKVAETAEILGVSQATFRNWSEGNGDSNAKNPVNGYRLFERGDLESFLSEIAKPVIAKRK